MSGDPLKKKFFTELWVKILAGIVVAAVLVPLASAVVRHRQYVWAAFYYLDHSVTLFKLLLFFTALAVLIAYWPQARELASRPFYEFVVRTARSNIIRAFSETGELASSLIVLFVRYGKQGEAHYYCMLEMKQVENGPRRDIPMYPGKRVTIFERPDTAAIDYVKEKAGIVDLRVSDKHHDILKEEEYPGAKTTQAPRPFKVLIERQPKRGRQAYNYDMIYVAFCVSGTTDQLPELGGGFLWRSISDIRDGIFKDVLDDVRQVILDAVDLLPAPKG